MKTNHGFQAALAVAIRRMRKANPGWGGKTLRCELLKGGWAEKELPGISSLNRFLKSEGFTRAYIPHSPLPNTNCEVGTEVHQLWQLDAEGNETVEGAGTVAIINAKDVGSRRHVSSYPAQMTSPRGHPDGEDYQTALRLAFCQYGLPTHIQTDHTSVFYDNTRKSPFPTRFHLWLELMVFDQEGQLVSQQDLKGIDVETLVGKQHLAIYLPALQLKTPFDPETEKVNRGSRLYETPEGSALSEERETGISEVYQKTKRLPYQRTAF